MSTNLVERANKVLLDTVLPMYRNGQTSQAGALEDLVREILTTPTPSTGVSFHGLRNSGKEDLSDLFRKSGIFNRYNTNAYLAHTPFLVFDGTDVRVLHTVGALLTYPDNTKVVVQWRGVDRSDYFVFSVAEMKSAMGL